VTVEIVAWMVFSRPSLRKIIRPPCGFVPTESQRNLLDLAAIVGSPSYN
jgi:F-box/leucine-rich repeat protein 2/20